MLSLSGKHDSRKLLLPVAVLQSDNPSDLTYLDATALLDTGATSSALCPSVVNALGLRPYEKRFIKVATEERLVEFFLFRIGLFSDTNIAQSNTTKLPYVFAELDGFKLQQSDNFDMILGMDVLNQCDFEMKRNGNWKLTFG